MNNFSKIFEKMWQKMKTNVGSIQYVREQSLSVRKLRHNQSTQSGHRRNEKM